MIHPRYHDAFRALTREELDCTVEALASSSRPELLELPDLDEGRVLLDYCLSSHVSQAEVIMSLRNDHRPAAVMAVERLMMRPIDRRSPAEVERERDQARPRPVVAQVRASEATTDTRKIRLLVTENPKRRGTKSHERFALYLDGMTVAEFLKKGGTRGDLNWDQERSLIRLEAE